MGMAAGQARLLSITSRMSDNELRAQIINNNKMRLATESSQVSEAYVTALNEAQLMFTSYDADKNSTYKPLTFKELTTYNPYNNQYSLVNSVGNILVSETDAKNFKNSNNVTEFLKKYNLEQTTSYFDNLKEYVTKNNEEFAIPFISGINLEGQKEYGYLGGFDSAEDTINYLNAIYFGNNTDLHPGYDTTLASIDYFNFQDKMDTYLERRDDYNNLIIPVKEAKFESDFKVEYDKILNILNGYNSKTSSDEIDKIYENIGKLIGSIAAAEYSNSVYYNKLISSLGAAKNNSSVASLIKAENGVLTFTYKNASFSINENNPTLLTITDGGEENFNVTGSEEDNNYVYTWYGRDDEGNEIEDDQHKVTLTIPSEVITSKSDAGDTGKATLTMTSISGSINNAKNIMAELRASIYDNWDISKLITNDPTSDVGRAYKNYLDAAKDLYAFEFNCDANNDTEQDNFANLIDNLDDISAIWNGMKDGQKTKFQPIYDVMCLDNLMNTYGEPKFAWIDKVDANEDGDAKAQWYENLYKRMQKGYQTLTDGLASSSEWIQFAFESGIVTMEQVDEKQEWNSMIYTSCSDIFEQTDSVAVARAEAEYKAAMNKIENKDKRYDLELKNIDTEHNSLQTEYDSIKAAIDKNIERTFKLYS